MGEIGIPRKEFLFTIQFWEARRILRGYNRRYWNLWSAERWSTYHIMCAHVGKNKLQEEGIHKITDLIPFPWDKIKKTLPSESEVLELQKEMEELNRNNNVFG